MSLDPVVIALDQFDVPPGGEVAGWFSVPSREDLPPETVSLVLRFHTRGKGDEDLHTINTIPYRDVTPGQPIAFRLHVPMSPRSYDGVIVKIHWEVVVTATWAKTSSSWLAKAPTAEHVAEFRVGLIEAPPQDPSES